MPEAVILPDCIVMGSLTWSLVIAWYVHPALGRLPLARALEPLLLLHAFRYIGLMFVVPGVTAAPLDPRFALPAAYGDLAAALLALVATAALRAGARGALKIVWVFNIWGFVDLLNAVVRGLLFTQDGDLGATYWIPATIVPLLLVTHGYIFWLLLGQKGKSGTNRLDSPAS